MTYDHPRTHLYDHLRPHAVGAVARQREDRVAEEARKPAGCLVEEIVAVELLEIADNDLEARCDAGTLAMDEA
jgi:hypothetical protein